MWPIFFNYTSSQAGTAPPPAFAGTLAFSVEYEKQTTPLRYYSDGVHLRVEAGKEGDPHLVWLVGLEDADGVVLLSPFTKSYTIEPEGPNGWQVPSPGGKRNLDRGISQDIPEPIPGEYMGLDCLQYTLKTEGPDTNVWILKDAKPFPLPVLRLWTELSDAVPSILRICRENNAIPVRIERNNWRGKSIFTLSLLQVDPTIPQAELFTIPGDYARFQMSAPGGGRSPGGGPGTPKPDRGDRRGPPPGSGSRP